jgi:hypothetical protein
MFNIEHVPVRFSHVMLKLVGDFSDFATYNFFFEIGMDTPVWPEFLTLTSVAS